MSEDDDDIVAALRRGEDGWEYAAADEIEALRAENARLAKERDDFYKNYRAIYDDEIKKHFDEIARLREALKPFAEICERCEAAFEIDDSDQCLLGEVDFVHLRAARAAIGETEARINPAYTDKRMGETDE